MRTLSDMMSPALCFLGFHDWTPWEEDITKMADHLYRRGRSLTYYRRKCRRCGRKQEA